MTTAVEIVVYGQAVSKGSQKPFVVRRKDGTNMAVNPKPRNVAAWETSIRAAAQEQAGGVFFDGPVKIAIVFYLQRPKSLAARVKHCTTRPDIDKCVRLVCDAMTGVIWSDDNLVVDLVALKRYAPDQPYVRIVVDHAAPVDEIAVEQDLFAPLQELRP